MYKLIAKTDNPKIQGIFEELLFAMAKAEHDLSGTAWKPAFEIAKAAIADNGEESQKYPYVLNIHADAEFENVAVGHFVNLCATVDRKYVERGIRNFCLQGGCTRKYAKDLLAALAKGISDKTKLVLDDEESPKPLEDSDEAESCKKTKAYAKCSNCGTNFYPIEGLDKVVTVTKAFCKVATCMACKTNNMTMANFDAEITEDYVIASVLTSKIQALTHGRPLTALRPDERQLNTDLHSMLAKVRHKLNEASNS